MQNTYIVRQKFAKNTDFSSKTAKSDKKCPVFAENRAKIDVFDVFGRISEGKIALSQKTPFFAKSYSKKLEFSWNHGRVISDSSWGYKTKNRLPLRGWRS